MLIVVRRDDHQLAIVNTDKMIQVLWLKADGDYNHSSVQMSHGRELQILTAITKIATPFTTAGTAVWAIPPTQRAWSTATAESWALRVCG